MAVRSDVIRGSGNTLVLTRTIDVPADLLFSLWSKPEHLVNWWGPVGFSLPSCEIDFRTGGAFRFRMRSATEDRWLRGVFREIVAPSRLEFTFAWGNAEQTTGAESVVTVTFESIGHRTKLTLRQAPFATEADMLDHEQGWSSTIDRLDGYAFLRGRQA